MLKLLDSKTDTDVRLIGVQQLHVLAQFLDIPGLADALM